MLQVNDLQNNRKNYKKYYFNCLIKRQNKNRQGLLLE